ncbi:MAG: hypothetical protein AAGI44_00755 [Pseudomonadota bacterium]
MPKNTLKTLFFTALVSINATMASAAGKATFQSGGEGSTLQTTLEYNDKAHLRMGVPGRPDSYMLFRDDKAYLVSQPAQGESIVMDLGSMMDMMGDSVNASMDSVQATPPAMKTFVSLTNTRRSETIAGISGDVYLLEYKDQYGDVQTEELVLSDDERVYEMTSVLFDMGKQMSDALSAETETAGEAFHEVMKSNQAGILRMGASFQLLQIEDKAPNADRFALPVQPTAIPDFGSIFADALGDKSVEGAEAGSTEGSAAEDQGSWSSALGNLFGRQADRQQDRVEEHVDKAVDETTDRAVDEALEKALDKIFGD